jgi:hypothetical protein
MNRMENLKAFEKQLKVMERRRAASAVFKVTQNGRYVDTSLNNGKNCIKQNLIRGSAK